MIVGIHQPNYIPWLGYFRKIAVSNVFVFFDNVQMPGGKSFVSRNAIKTAEGRRWLSVPVSGKNSLAIHEVLIAGAGWQGKHIRTLQNGYRYSQWLEPVMNMMQAVLAKEHQYLAELNASLVEEISRFLGFDKVRFERASKLSAVSQGAGSIGEILISMGASVYATGSGAGTRRHLDTAAFAAMNIETKFVSDDFPVYEQGDGEFEGNLSVLDAILQLGPQETARIILSNPWLPDD